MDMYSYRLRIELHMQHVCAQASTLAHVRAQTGTPTPALPEEDVEGALLVAARLPYRGVERRLGKAHVA